METSNKFRTVLIALLLLSGTLLTVKVIPVINSIDYFLPEEVYTVSYRYFFKTNDGNTHVKAFLPKANKRQQILMESNSFDPNINFEQKGIANNLIGVWRTKDTNSYKNIALTFTFKGKSKAYNVNNRFNKNIDVAYAKYLKPTKYIQSNDPRIVAISKQLQVGAKNDLQVLKNVFKYVNDIPSAPIITLTDALTALDRNSASCNGKSRLFIALARSLGYPSRIKGGIILEQTNKRTSHVWVEVLINGKWIPFDALNGHFAFLPANYLEIYEGDEFLILHTPKIQFDYTYEISKGNYIPLLTMNNEEYDAITAVSLWKLIDSKIISQKNLMLLLMLPLGGLLVAFLRNVIGLRTFGVFLPVLISFSLLETGFFTGVGIFIFLVLLVGAVSKIFNQLGLLHTPKLVISLTIMVLLMILGAHLGLVLQIKWLTSLTLFPTIILTISAERFSTLILEDGFPKATSMLFQTLLAVGACFSVLSVEWITYTLIIFPELLIIFIVLSMLLGKYIGLRMTELIRFKPLLNVKTI